MTRTSVCRTGSTQACAGHFSAGFTLLEILLVFAIIGMASILVVPNLGGLELRTFSAQVREASSLLNYARRIAVVSGQPATASFSVSDDANESSEGSGPSSSVGKWHSSGVALTYRDSTDRESDIDETIDITFYPEGGSTGGTLMLQLEDRVAAIEVDPFTGRVTTTFLDDR